MTISVAGPAKVRIIDCRKLYASGCPRAGVCSPCDVGEAPEDVLAPDLHRYANPPLLLLVEVPNGRVHHRRELVRVSQTLATGMPPKRSGPLPRSDRAGPRRWPQTRSEARSEKQVLVDDAKHTVAKLLGLTLPRAESSWRASSAGCGVVAPRVLCATDADPGFQVERPPSILTAAIPVYALTRIVPRFQRDAADERNASTTRDSPTPAAPATTLRCRACPAGVLLAEGIPRAPDGV